ncbi:MAG TPA: phosphohydrolase [Porphyromonadaceae bacterium]|nr:phosphohydrolase [Porphyromonadaceae bacterium]
MDCLSLIEKYYDKDSVAYPILVAHSKEVCEKAMEILKNHPELNANAELVHDGAMLHDIGILHTNAHKIGCYGKEHYIMHAFRGAEMLRREGLEKLALIAERHTGTGITKEEIIRRKLPIPIKDMIPVSIEEEIVCFADKFFSKVHIGTPYTKEVAIQKLEPYGREGVERFLNWCSRFL